MKVDFNEMRCCDELMTPIPEQHNLLDDSQSQSWVCLSCGSYALFKQGQFDEEELEELVLNYDLTQR